MKLLYHFRLPLMYAIAVAVFLPGLGNVFLLDDYSNLLNNQKVQLFFGDPDFLLRAWFSGIAERSFSRQLSFLLFAVEHAVWGGFDPVKMKALSLFVHLLNGLLVYKLVSLLLERSAFERLTEIQKNWLPGLVTFFWLISPANIGSVLYVVQRMNLLSATCVLAAIWVFVRMMDSQSLLRRVGWLVLFGFLLVTGYLFKENAILVIPFVCGLIWVTMGSPRDISLGLKSYTALIVAIFIIGYGLFAIGSDALQLMALFESRNFGILDRMLTQPFALFAYLGYALLPFPGRVRFYHDYLTDNPFFSLDPFNWIFVPALLLLIGLTVYLVLVRKNLFIYCTLGWFLLFHSLESSFLPLEPAYVHRNYLPSVGIFLGVLYLLFISYNILKDRLSAFIARAAMLTLMLCYGVTSVAESFTWGNPIVLLGREAEQYPISGRAMYSRASWLLNADAFGIYCNPVSQSYDAVRRYQKESIYGAYGTILASHNCGTPEKVAPAMTEIKARLETSTVPIGDVVPLDSLSHSCREESFINIGLQCRDVQEALQIFLDRPEAKSHKKYAGLLFLDARMSYENRDIALAQERVLEVFEVSPMFLPAHILMLDIHYFYRRCDVIEDSLDKYRESSAMVLKQIPGQTQDRYPECFLQG